MLRHCRGGVLAVLVVGAVTCAGAIAQTPAPAADATTAGVLWQPSMNVFRRFEVSAERM